MSKSNNKRYIQQYVVFFGKKKKKRVLGELETHRDDGDVIV